MIFVLGYSMFCLFEPSTVTLRPASDSAISSAIWGLLASFSLALDSRAARLIAGIGPGSKRANNYNSETFEAAAAIQGRNIFT